MSLESSSDKPKLFGVGVRWLLSGAVICVFSLNGVLRLLANQWPDKRASFVLLSIASVPDSLYARVPGGPYLLFELLFRWVVILLAAHLLLLLIASVRHQSPVILVSGISGLFIGLFALTWLSILILIIFLLLRLLGWIMALLWFVLSMIASFFLWPPVFYTILVVIGIVIVAAIVSVIRNVSFRDLWKTFTEWMRNLSTRPLVFLLALSAMAALIWFIGIPLWEHYISPILLFVRTWLAEFVMPILSWIGSLFLTLLLGIIVVFLVLLVLAVLGWQLADQLKSARTCGSDTHEAFRAGFAMGGVMGLVLLVCASNPTFKALVLTSWSETSPILSSIDLSATVYYLMPARIETLLHDALAKASPPIFDLACLILTLLLANSSLITGVLSRVTIKPLRGLVALRSLPPVGMALFGVVVVIAESFGNENT